MKIFQSGRCINSKELKRSFARLQVQGYENWEYNVGIVLEEY